MSCTPWVKLIETSHKVNKSKSVSSSGKTELTPLFLVGSFLKNNHNSLHTIGLKGSLSS